MPIDLQESKELHEEFHAHVQPIGAVPETNDWMYHYLLENLAKGLKRGSAVLDIGCGNGVLSLYCAKNGCRVLGIDISERAAEASAIAAKNLGLDKHVDFKAMLLEDLPDKPAYDLVILSEVIEHLPDDAAALAKIKTILKPGGKLYITTPSSRAFAHHVRLWMYHRDAFDERVGHLRRYTKASLHTLVEQAGFEVASATNGEGPIRNLILTTKLNQLYRPLLKFRLNRIFEWIDTTVLTPLLGEAQIIVVAKRQHG